MNGPLKFLTARKILPLLDLLATFKRALACSCSPKFCSCSQAHFLVNIIYGCQSHSELQRNWCPLYKLKPRFKIFSVLFQRKGFPYGLLQAENIRSARCSRVVLSKLLAARKANFLSLHVLAKKSQYSGCSRMLAKTIRHPLNEQTPRRMERQTTNG